MKKKASVKNVDFDYISREVVVRISAKDSIFIQEPTGYEFPHLLNSSYLIHGINSVLECNPSSFKSQREIERTVNENEDLKKENKNLLTALKDLQSWVILNSSAIPAPLVSAMIIINKIEKTIKK